MSETETVHQNVQDYYGKTLASSVDLQTSCCTAGAPPPEHREIMTLIDDEILDRFYGCGSPIPDVLEGLKVVDLGCGTGRDCFVISRLVGPSGRVIGVDMTDEQLAVGRQYCDGIMARFGYDSPNVEFQHGFIEDLAAAGIEDESVDLIVSNCVLNLAPDKARVFSEIFRVLKPGGELYFSDVYCDRRIPQALQEDPVFHGECLGGAMYTEDFRRLLTHLGCADFRVMSQSPIDLENPEIAAASGNLAFSSVTIRAFKLADMEDAEEDYGQVAIYKGTIPGHVHGYALDEQHAFETNRPVRVSGNTATMLTQTRFAAHFIVHGDCSQHFGIFEADSATTVMPAAPAAQGSSGGCC